MRKNSKLTIFISCCLAMVITLLFYLLAFDNIFTIPMRWLSLLFLLIIEAAGTVKVLKIDRNIFGVTNIILSLIHILVVLVLSVVFVNLLPLLIKQYVLLNMLLFVVVAIIDIVLIYFGVRAKESNQKYDDYGNVLHVCHMKSEDLVIKFRSSKYVQELQEISEMLKYSDLTALCGNESDLFSKLNTLEELLGVGEESAIKNEINEIENLIKLRSLQVKNEKRGSF